MKSCVGDVEVEEGFPHLGVADGLVVAGPQFESPAELHRVRARVREKTVPAHAAHAYVPEI